MIEVLVVLALIGLLSGTVALSIGAASRGQGAADREAALLVERLNRAAEIALLSGRPAVLEWEARGYRFLAKDAEGEWAAHDDPILAAEGDVALDGAGGRVEIGPDLLPPEGGPLLLTLRSGGGRALRVRFDGARARAEPADG